MNKKEEDKLVNAIIALHREVKGLRGDMEAYRAKSNLAIGELRISYMKLDESLKRSYTKLDESFNRYAKINEARLSNHDTRIERLEKKTPGGSYIVSEPVLKYNRKKRK